MNKIKVFSLGGLNENGKNLYPTSVDKNIKKVYSLLKIGFSF